VGTDPFLIQLAKEHRGYRRKTNVPWMLEWLAANLQSSEVGIWSISGSKVTGIWHEKELVLTNRRLLLVDERLISDSHFANYLVQWQLGAITELSVKTNFRKNTTITIHASSNSQDFDHVIPQNIDRFISKFKRARDVLL